MTTPNPEDTVLELAADLGRFIVANIVPERQAKSEAAAIGKIYEAVDAERVRRVAIYGEGRA